MFVRRDTRPASRRDDAVGMRARELGIAPAELFARAYVDAAHGRTTADKPFADYQKTGTVPEIVAAYLKKPAPRCENAQCPHPEKPARCTRTSSDGRTIHYFCSPECMDAAPRDARAALQASEDYGLVILAQVRIAMSNATYVAVDPDLIRPMPGQPRVFFHADSQMRLVQSLRSVGQMQPGIIRRIKSDRHQFELLDGERRHRGVLEAGLPTYRAMLVDISDEAAPFVVSVIANFNRAEHTVLELADAVAKMHETLRLTMKQIGSILGIHEVEASQLHGLRRLIPEVRDMLDPHLVKGHPLPKSAAIEISKQPSNQQLALAQQLLRKEMTVADLREHVRGSSGHTASRNANLNPVHRRRATCVRSRSIATAAASLLRLLDDEQTAAALTALTATERQELERNMKTALRHVGRCAELLGIAPAGA